jgi:hypothetical protein
MGLEYCEQLFNYLAGDDAAAVSPHKTMAYVMTGGNWKVDFSN